MVKLSIIIVNYNGKDILPDCLKSIYNQTFKDFEVILVDNASKDDSVYKVKDNFKKVKIIQNKRNFGFAKGNNIGIKASKGEYVLFLNPDTIMPEDFLKRIIEPMKEKKVGVVIPKIMKLLPDHSFVEVDSLGIAVPISGLGRDIKKYDEINKVIIGCGACMLYRRETLEDIKLLDEYFDEDFFCYNEDTDLGMRLILRGWWIATTDAYINHYHSTTMKSAPGYIQLLGHRNNILTVVKNYPKGVLLRALPQIIFWQLASIGIWCLRMKPFLILRLKLEALKLLPKMLDKRDIIQSRVKIDNFRSYLR